MSKRKQRDIELFLVDVLVAIKKIRIYVTGFSDEHALKCSGINWDATIRQLEIVGESLNNLLDDEFFNSMSPAYFRKVACLLSQSSKFSQRHGAWLFWYRCF